MNRRQKIWTVASLAVTTGAILGGVAVTSNAMAASGTPDADAPVTLEVISMGDATGGEAVHCTFTDVPIGWSVVPPADGLPAGVVVQAGGADGPELSGPVPEAAVQTGAIAAVAGTVISGSATVADGALPKLVEPENVREGTEEECAAIRPTAVPAPPAG